MTPAFLILWGLPTESPGQRPPGQKPPRQRPPGRNMGPGKETPRRNMGPGTETPESDIIQRPPSPVNRMIDTHF